MRTLKKLRRAIEHIEHRDTAGAKKPATATQTLIEQVQFYIFEHISQEITRDEIAAFVNFSPQYLSTVFKRETNRTLSDYIRDERIAFAKRLLKQTNLPISMICENVGYESCRISPQSFARSKAARRGNTARVYGSEAA